MRVPGVAIAGVEQIIDLAGEIGLPARVEGGGIGAPDQLVGADLRRGEVGAEGLGGRAEEIGLVPAHLVQVDHHHRVPFADRGDLAAGLGLAECEPVAIEIEHVVIDASARPRFVMLGRLPVGSRIDAGRGEEIVHEPRAPVGVLHRIDHHDGLAHDPRGARVVLCGEQVIGGHQRGIGRGDLVAVDPVGQPRHRQSRAVRGTPCRDIGEIGADRIEPRDVFRAGEDHVIERPAFPAGRILHHAGAVGRGGGERLEIGIGLVRRGDAGAGRMADRFGQGRDRGIEAALRKGLRLPRRARPEGRAVQRRQHHEPPARQPVPHQISSL